MLGTITVDEETTLQGPLFLARVHFNGDSSYVTGGTPGISAAIQAACGFSHNNVAGIMPQDCGGTYRCAYDAANDKLKVYAANGSEVAAGTSLSGTVFNLVFMGF